MQNKDRKTIYKLLDYIKPYWKSVVVGMLLASVVSITTGGVAWIIKPILDEIFIKKDMRILPLISLAFMGLYLVNGIAVYGQNYVMRSVGLKVIRNIRNNLYSHMLKMPLSFYHNNPSPVLMSRITNDVNRITDVATTVAAQFVRQVITFFVLLGILIYRDWFLSIMAILIIPFASMLIVRIGKKLKELSRRNQEKMADLNSILFETFSGSKIVKAFAMEEYEKERFIKENQSYYKISIKEMKRDEMVSPLMEFIGAVGIGLVIYYGGHKVGAGITTPGTFFSFIAAMTMMYEPVRKLSQMNNVIQQAVAAGDRIFDILDLDIDIKDSQDAADIKSLKDSIKINDLSFTYNQGEEEVLRDINLEIKKGEVVAIVGNSGAGKSTLVDMIPRFYDPQKGSITIDGLDLRSIKLNSLRGMIGVVTQETILFNDTIFNNIAYGRKDATEEEVHEAARLAYAHDFIMEMPSGYNTIAGEMGVRLSGGERQRLSIARAILKNPPIMILDEATSNLDSKSEELVQHALENLMKERTTLVIAHRLSTIINADRIVVMKDGRIVEIGSHQELIKNNGLYRLLHDIQYKQ
ncbi:MAG: lipid A export permease/ATP-binding protein MsbA [Nitrospinota bacterium]|nr:lipid A export permease/ATP-binding protein MsbA [Nitrospinota bacterium]